MLCKVLRAAQVRNLEQVAATGAAAAAASSLGCSALLNMVDILILSCMNLAPCCVAHAGCLVACYSPDVKGIHNERHAVRCQGLK